MVSVLPPFEAYSEDLARAKVASFGPSDAYWLQIAAILWRLGQLPSAERHPVLRAAATMLDGWASEPTATALPASAPETSTIKVAAHERSGWWAHLSSVFSAAAEGVAFQRAAGTTGRLEVDAAAGSGSERDWHEPIVQAVQDAGARLEEAGAFRLAFSLLSAFRSAFPELPPSLIGRVVAQQGRIARQTGDFDDALELYNSAERLGRLSGDTNVRIRALLGRAVLALRRGNFPETRRLYRLALRHARSAGLPEFVSAAHHGLLTVALAARDLELALRHGWTALQNSATGPDQRAEILNALGDVAFTAGFPEAALRAYLSGLFSTNLLRMRLPILGNAAKAAAELGQDALLNQLSRVASRELAHSQHVAENAYLLLELAEAHGRAGHASAAQDFANRAADLAREGHFFEVLHRAEQVLAAQAPDEAQSLERTMPISIETPDQVGESTGQRLMSSATQAHLQEPSCRQEPQALSGPSRRVIRSLEALRLSETAEALGAC